MKRIRLIACLIGICLSFTALGVGVYAAVRRTAMIEGSIEYEVTLAYVDIQTKLYKAEEHLSKTDLEDYVTQLEETDFWDTFQGLKLVDTSKTFSSLPADQNKFNYTVDDLSFDGGENSAYAYFFVVNIVNKSQENNVWAYIDSTMNGSEIFNTYNKNSNSRETIDTDGTNIVLSIGLDDIKQDIELTSLNYKIVIGSGEIPQVSLTYDIDQTTTNASLFADQTMAVNTEIDEPELPVANDKMFVAWYKDQEYTSKVEFPLTITNNTTLYARQLDGTLPASKYQYDATSDSFHVIYSADALPEITVIPDLYTGSNGTETVTKPVTKIVNGTSAQNPLGNNTTMKELYIGNNVTYLGVNASTKATALETLYMGKNVSEFSSALGQFNFSECTSLKNITLSPKMTTIKAVMFGDTAIENLDFLHDGITTIEQQGFNRCNNLTSITIPETLTNLGQYAFLDSQNLVDVKLHSKIRTEGTAIIPFLGTPFETIVSDKAVQCYDNTDEWILVRASQNTTNTNQIENYNKVTKVLGGAFLNMQGTTRLTNTSLTTIDFPKVKKIGCASFDYCVNLVNVSLPELEIVGYQSFNNCSSLISINLPKVKKIDKIAFKNCTKLENIYYPNVEHIGLGVFQYSNNLNINLPEGLLWIGDFAFNHCEKVTQTSITIPSTLIQLGGDEFVGDNNTNGIVGSHMFYNCGTEALTEFIVAEGNPYFVTHEGVLYTKDYKYLVSYPAAKTTTSYEMPEGCEDIFELGFSRAFNLKSLTIPNSLTVEIKNHTGFNHPQWTNLADGLYWYTAIEEIEIKDDNTKYSTIDGILYSKDGTELIYCPTRKGYGDILTFADSCTTLNLISILAVKGTYSYGGLIKNVGGCPTTIHISEYVTQISDAMIKVLNNEDTSLVHTYSVTVSENSQYFEVVEGKLVRKAVA